MSIPPPLKVPADKPIVRDLTSDVGRQEQQQNGLILGNTEAAPIQQQSIPRPPATISNDPAVQVVGPHNEGARLVLQCETQGGYPEPMLTWWRNGRLLDDSYEIVSASDGQVVSRHSAGLTSGQSGGLVDVGGAGELDDELLTAEMFRSRARLVGDPNELPDLSSASSNFQDPQSASPSGTSDGENLLLRPAANVDGESSLPGGSIETNPANDDLSVLSDQLESDAGGVSTTTTNHINNRQPSAAAAAATPASHSQNRLIRNRLELRALTRNDLLANYSCQAWNTKLSEPPATSIMIDMNRKYPIPLIRLLLLVRLLFSLPTRLHCAA